LRCETDAFKNEPYPCGSRLVDHAASAIVATEEDPQHLCADKGYDYDYTRFLLAAYGHYTPIKSRGDEKAAKTHIPGCRARRWVVEGTHSWLNRFRRLLICWEKKVDHDEALLHLAFAFLCFRNAEVFGKTLITKSS